MVLLIKNFLPITPKENIHSKDQLLFLKRLYRLLERGYSLSEALEVIGWDERLKKVADTIHEAVLSGKPFDEALKQASFHPLIVLYIYFVRVHGNLMTSLENSIGLFEQRLETIDQFKKTTRYPLILLLIFFLLLLMIHFYIFPAYEEMFFNYLEAYQTVKVTFLLYRTGIYLFFGGILFIVLAVFLWKYYEKRLSIPVQLQIYSRIPLYRSYLRLQTSFYFASHVSLFLRAGLSINQILEHLKEQDALPIVQYYADWILIHVKKGFYLDDLLYHLTFIDGQLASLFQRHNHIEYLEKDLQTYAEFVQEYMQERITRALIYLQPIAYIAIGSFIIIIYLSILWPMFQLIDAI